MSSQDTYTGDLNPHNKPISEFVEKLYEFYATLRETAPIWKDPETGFWLISGFEEVSTLVKDSKLSPNQGIFYPNERTEASACLRDSQDNWLTRQEEPRHSELRKEFLDLCSPQSVAKMEAFIRSEVERLASPLKTAGELEFVSGLTIPLVISVFAKWFGVGNDQLKDFAYAAQRTAGHLSADEDGNKPALLAGEILTKIFSKQTIPNSHATDGEPQFIRKERVDNLTLMVFAGFETLVNFIPNALLELLKHESEAAYFRLNSSCRDSAVDELLRFGGSVLAIPRVVLKDFDFKGHEFKTSDYILLLIGAANRDPKQFPEPDKLDIHRDNTKSLALGGGSHYCIGSYMVKMMTRITLAYMLEEFPNLSVDKERMEYVDSYGMRGLFYLYLNA